MKRVSLILIALLAISPFAVEAGRGGGASRGGNAGCSLDKLLGDLPLESLKKGERSDLTYMREEEKLARDVYLSLHEKWGLRVFRQIAKAETQHMASALVLIDKYGLEDPVGANALGIFTQPLLQEMYEELSAAGLASVEAALLVGAAIEDLDISDLQRSLEKTNNEDLSVLYQNLMKGSRNHLRAFTTVLESYGESYEPVYLSLSDYEEILDSPKERGVLDADGEILCGGGRR